MSPPRIVSTIALIQQLWRQAELPVNVLENTLRRGNLVLVKEPSDQGQAIQSSFHLTAVAQACCAAIALAERLRCALVRLEKSSGSAGELQSLALDRVQVDASHALAEYKGWTKIHLGGSNKRKQEMLKEAIESDSEDAKRVLGIDPNAVADWDALAGLYRCRPSSSRGVPAVVRIHTNFPHHKLGILQLLNLAPSTARWNDVGIHETIFSRVSKQDLQRELDQWDAFEFEAAAQKRGLCVTVYRSRAEWEASEMGAALKTWMGENVDDSAFRISRIASASNSSLKPREPNERLRIIDMSRVIAGPIAARILAAYGSDVLLLSSEKLPNLPLRELDTARGKRTAFVELPKVNDAAELRKKMKDLIEVADVVSQAYRPQGLAERGLSAEAAQRIRPGIVYAELCAFGFTGPWKDRRAYDSLTQTATGINYLEGLSYQQHHSGGVDGVQVEPKALPVQALDYAAGSLMCFAILACQCRALLERLGGSKDGRAEEDGWKVQISLASTAEWIHSLGQIHGDDAWTKPPQEIIPSDVDKLADMTSSYQVRGLADGDDSERRDVRVLAVRHASIPAEGEAHESEDSGFRWTVPAHLGVDKLKWT
ncbi:hypothetical protein PHSY_004733 [Pseudozyma hubeiensis SY62]|uniref:CAIB/BAIF family enzyme n=1 Tax=Pseudozyma hubeiensis (strain SY62) TaxID=1305764 RepID=R9P6W6_PSEHS|nr:hypothetical protein PHSY_004733 [Pseudozyma hubeiensis SY62]GAC97148.1 hypothetical protein PHSY_004733 [Pseudozyma hubeiensis SY62]